MQIQKHLKKGKRQHIPNKTIINTALYLWNKYNPNKNFSDHSWLKVRFCQSTLQALLANRHQHTQLNLSVFALKSLKFNPSIIFLPECKVRSANPHLFGGTPLPSNKPHRHEINYPPGEEFKSVEGISNTNLRGNWFPKSMSSTKNAPAKSISSLKNTTFQEDRADLFPTNLN